ncbi:MAG: hypothetical protein NC489_14300 [Ruminococcus flavefaciens]|nr:hypothetical protein [Ruminococcus flavefaciens]
MIKLESNKCIEQVIYKKNNIIIYGAGGVGKVLIGKLMHEYPNLSLLIAVSAKDSSPYYLLGKKVVCINDLTCFCDDCIVIIATLEKEQMPILKHLETLGFNNVYGVSDRFYEVMRKRDFEQYCSTELIYYNRYVDPYVKNILAICKEYQRGAKEYVDSAVKKMQSGEICISRLVVTLGSKCSLQCRDCNNLMPYFRPQKDLDVKKILRSLGILTAKVHAILKCELIGGEPFLSDHLSEVLDFLIEQKNVYRIEITTNGTRLPKQEQIVILRNKKVKVRISDYGKLVNKQTIITFLEKNSISYELLEIERWTAAGKINKRKRDIMELKDIYHNCFAGYYCKTLYEDKLFACPRGASLWALGYEEEQEYIEIEENLSIKILKDFFLKSYFAVCAYCDKASEKVYVEPAIQLKS